MERDSYISSSEISKKDFLANLHDYLLISTWEKVHEIDNLFSIWSIDKNDDYLELHVPETLDLSDYYIRIVEVLEVLSGDLNRTLREVFDAISLLKTDKLKIKIVHSDTEDGLIPLADGVALHKSVYDILMSASQSSLKKQRYFQGKKVDEAVRMVRNTRLGQSEVGSYVITVVIPLAPTENNELFETSSFSRVVSETLESSLEGLKSIIGEKEIDAANLLNSVDKGVSANLCGALAELSGDEFKREFSITIEYSGAESGEENKDVVYKFSSNEAKYLHSASEILKGDYVAKNYTGVGLIKRLDRDAGVEVGQVTVVVLIGNRDRSVKLDLDAVHYALAIRAHRDKIYVEFHGDVQITPRSAKTIKLDGFKLLENMDMLK